MVHLITIYNKNRLYSLFAGV